MLLTEQFFLLAQAINLHIVSCVNMDLGKFILIKEGGKVDAHSN
jgi:hypothetical protein